MVDNDGFNHSMKRRAQSHDYNAPGFYMITLVTKGRLHLLGELVDRPPALYVKLSDLGRAIRYQEIKKIHEIYPDVDVWRQCIMPDHIHMIVRVKNHLPEGRHLGTVINGFKSGCNNAYWNIHGKKDVGLFEVGYNDRLLFGGEHLKRWKKYLTDNPRRLALKRRYPDLFTVMHDINIGGINCQAIGNIYLLNIPDKMSVIVHTKDSEETYDENFKSWMACGERGGVLISAAISPREKKVMREAMNRGYCLILLKENGFDKNYKPSGEAFDACANGQLLQISPWQYHFDKRTITRSQCLYLNRLAVAIASDTSL